MSGIEAIIRTYGGGLSRVAMAYEADPALREDLVQEMLIAIHRALPGLRDESRMGPYVFRIAHNRAVSHVAHEAARKRVLPTRDGPGEIDSGTPESLIAEQQRQTQLAGAVRQLPIPYRQVISLALEGMSYAEIGQTLDISVSNVGIRLNRAKSMLRKGLAND